MTKVLIRAIWGEFIFTQPLHAGAEFTMDLGGFKGKIGVTSFILKGKERFRRRHQLRIEQYYQRSHSRRNQHLFHLLIR